LYYTRTGLLSFTGLDKREVRERGKGRKQRRTTISNDIFSIVIG
jgi:hypothetical protein